jgi:hypothetical protein
MEVNMFRKALVITGTIVLATATLTAVPAGAATKISNGVACSKSGAKAKSSGTNYVCAKNALVKNSKLTWLSTDCIKTVATYKTAIINLPKIKKSTEDTVANLDADIVKQKIEIDKANKLIPEFEAKIAVINTTLATLRADTANLVKNKATIDKYAGAVKSYQAAIKAYAAVAKQGGRSEAARGQALAQYENAKADISSTLDMAKLICAKGY